MLLVAVSPPALDVGRHSITARMVQYVLGTEMAVPLLMLGLAAVPAITAPAVLGRLWRFVCSPVMAGAIELIVLTASLIPAVYVASVSSPAAYLLSLVVMFASAAPLWWSASHGATIGQHGHMRVFLLVVVTAIISNVLGFFMLTAGTTWYPPELLSPPWDATPLADQHTAGGVLVFVPDLIDFAALGALFIAWMNEEERRQLAREAAQRPRA